MRKNNKLRIGLFLAILFVFAIIFNCRTAKSSVTKEKVSIEKSELKIDKFDSVSKIVKDNFLLKIDSSSWKEVSNQFDFTFSGESNEDEFEFIKTENGYKFKGKGTVNYKGSEKSKDSTKIYNQKENVNEKTDVRKNGTTEIKSKENQTKIDKNKQNKSVGFNWNFTIILIVGLVVSIVGFYVYTYFNK